MSIKNKRIKDKFVIFKSKAKTFLPYDSKIPLLGIAKEKSKYICEHKPTKIPVQEFSIEFQVLVKKWKSFTNK
jgi:hypothetical protein